MLLERSNNLILMNNELCSENIICSLIKAQIQEVIKKQTDEGLPTYIIINSKFSDTSILMDIDIENLGYTFYTINDLNLKVIEQHIQENHLRKTPQIIVINAIEGISDFFQKMYKSIVMKDLEDQKLKYRRPVVFFINDFDKLPAIKSIPQIITCCLGHHTLFNLMVQSHPQVEKASHPEVEKIYGKFDGSLLMNNHTKRFEFLTETTLIETHIVVKKGWEKNKIYLQ